MLESVKCWLFRGDSTQIYKLGKYMLQELEEFKVESNALYF